MNNRLANSSTDQIYAAVQELRELGQEATRHTGQVEEVKLNGAAPPPPAPKEASKRVVGQAYTAPNGQVAVWNGKDWDAPK